MNHFANRLYVLLALLSVWILIVTPALAAENLTGIGIGAGNNWARSWVDVNGDGLSDFCYRYDPDGERLRCHYSKKGAYASAADLDVYIGRNEQPYQWWVDVDGDGISDICRANVGGPTVITIDCRLSSSAFLSAATRTLAFSSIKLVYFADVNGDGRMDLCYRGLFVEGGAIKYGIICDLSTGTTFTGGVRKFELTEFGDENYPRAFVDFNGDGFPDFCRTTTDGKLHCFLNSDSGFTGEDIVSAAIDRGSKDGASFVDVNGDGKADYCRVTGTLVTNYQLRCTLSTGVGWDTQNELISPVINPGNATTRWWIDINADGLPDFCRSVGTNPDTSSTTAEVADVTSALWCRMNKGGGSDTDPTGAFFYSDIELTTNFGRGDGGRQWCDPTGSGLPVLCRNSLVRRNDGPPVETCDENGACTISTEYTQYALVTGLGAAGTTQANAPLLTAYNDGLGAETRIGYLPLSNALVYARSGFTNTPRRTVGPPPSSRVVYETRAWLTGSAEAGSGLTLTGNARYFYGDLTTDTWAGTSRGFRERWMFSEGSNTIDHTVFFQGLGPAIDGSGSVENDLREIGLVKTQKRYAVSGGVAPAPGSTENGQSQRYGLLLTITGQAMKLTNIDPNDLLVPSSPFLLVQQTDNVLGDTIPANPRYRYIRSSSVRSYDVTGSGLAVLPTTATTTQQDNYGNVLRIDQTKAQSTASGTLTWTTTTINDYPDGSTAEGQKWLRLGRLKKSTVTSSAPSLDAQIAANARSAGTSANASAVSSSLAAVAQEAPKPLPLPPQLLMPILQLLLED